MATPKAVFSPGTPFSMSANAGAASAAAVAVGAHQLIQVACASAFQFKLGAAASVAAAATSTYVPANTVYEFETGANTYLSIFNPGASPITVVFTPLSQT